MYLFEIATKKEHNLTANPFNDSRGTVTPDGKSVVFISDREAGVAHLFSVPLDRQKEDPNDPLVRERLKKAAPARGDRGGQTPAAPPAPGNAQAPGNAPAQGNAPAPTPGPAPAPTPLTVDTTRIDRRAVQLTTGEQAIQAYFLSADGKVIYFRSADERGPGLFTITIEGKDRRRISDGPFQGLTPTKDRRKIFYTQNQDVYHMELTGERRKTQVMFAFSVKVDQRAEWAQILDESWRVMKYRFYDEKMHGRDWAAMQRQVRTAAQVRRREPGCLRPRQRDDRRAQRLAYRRQRPAEPGDRRRLPDPPSRLRARAARTASTGSRTSTATAPPTRNGSS